MSQSITMADLIYVGFGKRVVALNRDTGELLWEWTAPRGSGYAAVLVDGDRLIVSVMGYTYCLDPATGRQLWSNDLPGLGTGVACIATVRGSTGLQRTAAQEIERSRQSTAHTTTITG